MGVDVPSSAALNILSEQKEWMRKRERRSEAAYLHKRYDHALQRVHCTCTYMYLCIYTCTYIMLTEYYTMSCVHTCTHRNISKRAKSTRHEKERAYMEQLRCAGATVGEYVGNGQGETERTDTEDKCDEDAEPEVDDHHECDDASEGSSDDAHPLLFFYDCETTGFSVYSEHITEIAAKVVGVPLSSLSQPTFSSLLKTSRNITKKGITIALVMNTI